MTAILAGAAVVAVVLLLLAATSPAVLARLVARAYPCGDPRRDELVAEIQAVGVRGRFCWVLELVEVMVRDALPARWSGRPRSSRIRRPAKAGGASTVDIRLEVWLPAVRLGRHLAGSQKTFLAFSRERRFEATWECSGDGRWARTSRETRILREAAFFVAGTGCRIETSDRKSG